MPTLHRAVAQAQRPDAARRIARDLHLDMPATFESALEEEAVVAERDSGLGTCRAERLLQPLDRGDDTDAAAATARTGLDQQRPAKFFGGGPGAVLILDRAAVPWHDGDTDRLCDAFGRNLVAKLAHARRRRTDEEDAARLEPLDEEGILGEESPTWPDRVSPAAGDGLENPLTVEPGGEFSLRIVKLHKLVRESDERGVEIAPGTEGDCDERSSVLLAPGPDRPEAAQSRVAAVQNRNPPHVLPDKVSAGEKHGRHTGSGAFAASAARCKSLASGAGGWMRVLVIEDDNETARFLEKGLRESGWTVDRAKDGPQGLSLAVSGPFDALVVDRMLPGLDGLSIVEALRKNQIKIPVLFLSARGSVEDRVAGLRAGGDDYLVKPFAFSELLARLEALTRRGRGEPVQTDIRVGDLVLDLLGRSARRGSRELELKPREWAILEFLARRAGQVVTRTMLLEGVWDYHFDPQTNVIDVHISRLRQKVDAAGDSPLIETVRGAGYRIRGELGGA